MNVNENPCFKKEKKKEDSVIRNDDLFEQDCLESDDDQIILNEERDEECSFFSDNAENELNKLNIIPNNLIKDENNNTNNNDNIIISNDIEEIKIKEDNKENNKEIKNELNKDIKVMEDNKDIKEIKDNKDINEIKKKEDNKDCINNNLQENKITNEIKPQNNNTAKNYFSKKVLYKKNKINKDNKKNEKNISNIDKEKEAKNEDVIKKIKSSEKNNDNTKTKDRKKSRSKSKSKNSYINKMKEKKNMKINYENHFKLMKNSSRNDEGSKSGLINEKNNILSKSEVSYDKYGNKTIIKKKEYKDNSNKFIKIDKKMNRSFDNHFNPKKIINDNSFKNIRNYSNNDFNSPKITHKKINFTNAKKDINSNKNMNRSCAFISKKSTKKLNEEKENKENKEKNADGLKKILMNKINNQINEIVKNNKKMFFNENNKLVFLGFCDILFELGFLHIKETEIKDISNIKNHINDLYTQPFTNRAFLSEDLLFSEQKLLICAWKTILNNFILLKDFNSLPKESEEISLDDCKLFIFIVTGLFIGFNNKCINDNNNNNKFKSEKKPLKTNKSLKNLRRDNINKDISNKNELNQSFSKTSSSKNKYSFRRKSENNNNLMDSNNESNHSNNASNENILKNILENRQKSEYNYKSILKIKNFFNYFAELRKLYNLYKKDLKIINTKKVVDKDLTFKPKTNKNNKIILNKFSAKMDFFQRNDLIKKRNEKKIMILQKERSQKLLKECTFEPCKDKNKNNSNKKKLEQLNPKEISNRLYHSQVNSNKLTNNCPNSTCKHGEKIMLEKKFKEVFQFAPNINKNFNREMFIKSPLDKDELLNKRIKDLREANLDRIINNYEKNIRGVLSSDVKKDKNLLKEIISAEKGGMKLDMEKKSNKDTFDNFQNFNLYDFIGLNNYFYENEINEPLFSVEVKIKQNIKTIEVYKDDAPEKLAYDFCVENMLGKGSYEKIVNIIKEKLDEINKGNFNENVDINNNNDNLEQNNSIKDNDNNNLDKVNDINKSENKEKNKKKNEIMNTNIDLNDCQINNENNNNKEEYINNIDNNAKSEKEIKEKINQEEINKINFENIINKNYSEEERKNATNEIN